MSIKIVAKIHPLDATDRIVREVEPAPLDRLYADLGVDLPLDHARFMIGDRIITDPSVVPEDGQTVYIVVVPGGGNTQDTGKAMGWAGAAMIAAGIGLTFLSGGTLGGLGAIMIGSGVSMMLGGVVLYNYEIPDLTSGSRDQIEQASNLRGGRNKTNADGPTPLILGRHRIYPHNGADPYTEIASNEQYLHQLFVIGQRDLQIEGGSWRIGDTDADEFTDWSVDVVQNGGVSSKYPKVVTEIGIGREIVKLDEDGNDGSIVITTPTKTNEILVDILFNGLVKFDDDGDKKDTSVVIVAKYKKKEDPDSSYQSLGLWFDHSKNAVIPTEVEIPGYGTVHFPDGVIVDRTTDPKRLTIHKVLNNAAPGGADYSALNQYDVKLSRYTDDSDDTSRINSAYWMSLRAIKSIRPIPNEVQGDLSVAAFTVKATNQFNGALDQVSCVAQLLARDYNGVGTGPGAWSTRATSNPASCFLYVLTSSAVNPRPKSDSRIPWATLESWHSFCEEHDYRCDMVIDSDIDQDSLLALIAQCGRATTIKSGGKYSVIVDREKPVPMQLITPRNSWDYSGSKAFPELPHALKMSFVNEDLDWQTDQVVVYSNGYNQDGSGGKVVATTFEEITCKGVTKPSHAWKEGRYKMAATELRCERHQVTMDLEYITANIGDRALFSHDVIMVGLCPGTRITSIIKDSLFHVLGIRVDEELDIEAGKSYAVTIRTKVGLTTVGVVAPIGTTQELAFQSEFPGIESIEVENLVAFGEAGKIAIDVLVTDIVPQADLTARLTLIDYAPEIFDLIDDPSLEIPDHDPMISKPGSFAGNGLIISIYDLKKEASYIQKTSQLAAKTWYDTRYIRSVSQPEQPTEGDPPGSSPSIPSGSDPLWATTAEKTNDGIFVTQWSVYARAGSGGAVVLGTVSPPPFSGLEGDRYRDTKLAIEYIYQYGMWTTPENFSDDAVTPREKARLMREWVVVSGEYQTEDRLATSTQLKSSAEWVNYNAAYMLLYQILFTAAGATPPVLSDLTTVSAAANLGANITAQKNAYEVALAALQSALLTRIEASASGSFNVYDGGVYDGTEPAQIIDGGEFTETPIDSDLSMTFDGGVYDGSAPLNTVDGGEYDGTPANATKDGGVYSISAVFALPQRVFDCGVFDLL